MKETITVGSGMAFIDGRRDGIIFRKYHVEMGNSSVVRRFNRAVLYDRDGTEKQGSSLLVVDVDTAVASNKLGTL